MFELSLLRQRAACAKADVLRCTLALRRLSHPAGDAWADATTALLSAQSSLASLRAEQAADRLCSSTARPVATSGVCE